MPRKKPEKKAKGRRADRDGQISVEGAGYRARTVVGYDLKTGRPKKKSRKVATRDEACEAIRQMQALYAAGKLAPAVNRTLEGYLQRWLEHVVRPNRSAATYLQYEWIVQTHILPHLGTRWVDADAKQMARNVSSAEESKQIVEKLKKLPKFSAVFFTEGSRPTRIDLDPPS